MESGIVKDFGHDLREPPTLSLTSLIEIEDKVMHMLIFQLWHQTCLADIKRTIGTTKGARRRYTTLRLWPRQLQAPALALASKGAPSPR